MNHVRNWVYIDYGREIETRLRRWIVALYEFTTGNWKAT